MSNFMHHNDYDPEIAPPTHQHFIELIDKFIPQPYIPIWTIDNYGSFTTLRFDRARGVVHSFPSGPRYYVACRECYDMLNGYLSAEPYYVAPHVPSVRCKFGKRPHCTCIDCTTSQEQK